MRNASPQSRTTGRGHAAADGGLIWGGHAGLAHPASDGAHGAAAGQGAMSNLILFHIRATPTRAPRRKSMLKIQSGSESAAGLFPPLVRGEGEGEVTTSRIDPR